MVSSASGDLTKLVSGKEMLTILECPVCNELPFPPIFLCLKGHNICKKCKPKLTECPLCKCGFSDTRNFAVEKLILSSFHTCSYKVDGCKIIEKGEYIESHMERCKYKPVRCPLDTYDNCNGVFVNISATRDHLISKHEATIHEITNTTETCTFADEDKTRVLTYSPGIVEYDGKDFLANVIYKYYKFIWILMLIGANEEGTEYDGQVTLKSNTGIEISWKFPIYSTSNRTMNSFVLDEPEVFKPFYRWKDLRSISTIDWENSTKFEFSTTYKITKRRL